MANRLNKQSPQLRLKDSIKKEMSRNNRNTLPLHCYAEAPKSLKDIISYSSNSKDNFSLEDIVSVQNNKNYKISYNDFEDYNKYIESLSDEQKIIYGFNDYYDLTKEETYEKRFCSDLDKLPNDVEICMNHLYKSISWFNNEIEEIEKLNNFKNSEINKDKKYLNKLLKPIQQYANAINKYSVFWNKSITDLIILYNKYSNAHSLESLIHNLVVISSLIKKQDIQNHIDKIITDLYKQHIEVLDSKILKALFLCSLIVKSLIIQELGETREFVMEKIIPNNKLKQMFFGPSDDNN